MTEFSYRKAEELVTFRTGKLDSNALEEGGRYPFFTCAQETYSINKYAFDTECVLLAGNNAGGIFPLKFYNGKFNAYQRTYIIESRDSQCLNIKYLYFFLRPLLKAFEQQATGATTKFLTLKILNNIKVALPDVVSQKKIAAILSAYDDLIENNQRRIALLEKMAEEIYREWFVRLRFPGHEKVKKVKGVPEGWQISELQDVSIEASRSVKEGAHLADRYYLPLDMLNTRKMNPDGHLDYTAAQSSLVTFEKGDILFGAMRPYLHKVAIAPFAGITRTTCFVIRPRTPQSLSWLFLTLFLQSSVDYASMICNGSDRPYAVWNKGMERMKLLYPDDALLIKFDEAVRPILDSITSMYFVQLKLRDCRDKLLPRLISGKLSVEHLDIRFPPGMEEDA